MKILVTGGGGYIGTHTLTLLTADYSEIAIIDNFCNSKKTNLLSLGKKIKKKFKIFTGDIGDADFLNLTFQSFLPDLVLHLAGFKSASKSIVDPLGYYRNNVSASITLLTIMSKFGVERIIFSSSATVYGIPHYLPLDEKHSVSPINPYGSSKAFIEKIIIDWTKSKPERTAIILRYFNPIGAHPKKLIGEEPVDVPENLVPVLVQAAAGRIPKLLVFGNDLPTRDGTGERDFVHVMDIARAHILAIKYFHRVRKNLILNLGTGNGTTVFELIKIFESITGKKVPTKVVLPREGDIPISFSSGKKAKKILGWEPKYSLEEMLKDAWEREKSI